MAENLLKKPQKGILKTSSSFDQSDSNKYAQDIKWDEMNILQTLHPPDKDYGHMKIDEPKTPYSYYKDNTDGEVSAHDHDTLDANLLAEKISLGSEKPPKALIESPSDDDEEYEDETEEERAKRTAFEYKRKMHYNEFYAVKLARKLMARDEDDEEDDDEDSKENIDEEKLN